MVNVMPTRKSYNFLRRIVFVQCIWTLVESSVSDFSKFPATPGQGNLNEDNVVYPIRLDLNGRFLTRDLHFAKGDFDKENFRPNGDADDEHRKRTPKLLYSVPSINRHFILNLTKNEDLIPRDFMIERIGRVVDTKHGNSINSTFTRGTQWSCHFRGHVEGEPNSRVALSTCHGLTGLIITQSGEYFLESAEPYVSGEVERAQAHKIYRRDVSAILDHPSDPKSHLEKPLKHDKRENMERIRMEERSKDESHLEENPYPSSSSLFFGESSKEFCGVLDTRRRYRHAVRKREHWENRHHKRDRRRVEDVKRRSKRSVSVERMIEMLVVADKSMVDYYEANDHGGIEKYVLTIVNMVAELFKDPTIGNSMHVSLVRLILVEDEEKGPKITSDAEKTLDVFCKWAKKINPKGDDHPNHHDVAVLLTRLQSGHCRLNFHLAKIEYHENGLCSSCGVEETVDHFILGCNRREICSQANKSCETLGLAHVAGMCQSHRSCSLNQDIGLSLAYTVAHEIGHNFAMHHDGQMNDCKQNPRHNHVMSSHLTTNKLPMTWSSCSKKYITKFLDRNWGFCLNDKPSDHPEFSPPVALPGVIYDADHQCRLMFGEDSRYCHDIGDMCDRLWCNVDGTCRTRLHAAVPGTECGKNKWCLEGKCVSNKRQPQPVDGVWGMWSEWSSCSRTCEIGISSSIRHCDNPVPQNGGNYCIGARKRYRTCSKWRCRESEGAPSFRAQQCSEYNDVLYKNRTFTWEPVESALYPCELHCYTRSGKFYFADRMRDKVIDGTLCFPGSDDICVDGICRRIGCDKDIGSSALEDRCGVCHGNGSSCYEVKKIFSRKKGEEYSPAALIPLRARNIEITEIEAVSNFLALRHARNKTLYYLNGNYMIQWDTMFQLAGTQFSYRRENETRDIITAPGPLTEAIMLMILFVEENPGVSIEYTMPYDEKFDPSPEQAYPEFSWKVRGWTDCTRECGTRSQSLNIVCEELIAGPVEDLFCNAAERPAEEKRSCNETPCEARWSTSRWDACFATCGSRSGVQRRTVECVRSDGAGDNVKLNVSDCVDAERPEERKKCRAARLVLCPVWKTGGWQQCSKSCGGGVKIRTVQCTTLITDDVIDIDDVGDTANVDEIDIRTSDVEQVPLKIRKQTGGSHGIPPEDKRKVEKLQRATRSLTSIEFDSIDREFDPDGYNVEEDSLCDSTIRPNAQKKCKTDLCVVTTSPGVETTLSNELTIEDEMTNTIFTEDKSTQATIESDDGPVTNSTFGYTTDAGSQKLKTDSGRRQNAPGKYMSAPGGLLNDKHEAESTNSSFKASSTEMTTVSPLDNGVANLDATKAGDDGRIVPNLVAVPVFTTKVVSGKPDGTSDIVKSSPASPKEKSANIATIELSSADRGSPATRTVPFVEDVEAHVSEEEVTTRPNVGSSRKRENSSTAETEKMPTTTTYHITAKEAIGEIDEFDIGNLVGAEDRSKQFQADDDQKFHLFNTLNKSKINESLLVDDENLFDVDGDITNTKPNQEAIVPEMRNTDFDSDVKNMLNNNKKSVALKTTFKLATVTNKNAENHETVITTSPPTSEGSRNFLTQNPEVNRITGPSTEGEWIVGEWDKCSVTCGVGAKIRQVRCSVKHELCNQTRRPVPAIICKLRPCAKWVYGEWSKCSTMCGTGTRTKAMECADERTGKMLRPHHCRHSSTLSPVKVSCHQNKCLRWRTSRWNSCSEPCGTGAQRRRVVCPRKGQCNPSLKPKANKSCFARLCVDWKPMKWNKCSVHCGGGIRRRAVVCVERENDVRTNTSLCQPGLRPTPMERCNLGQCPVTDYDFSNCHADRLTKIFCVLLQKMGRCVQPSLAIQCCVTCKTYLRVRHKDKMS